jgi:glutamine phosphoribosylpyrophosphate amidotransferase
LIASSKSPDEICRFLGADSLGYLSLPSLKHAVADTEGRFCTSCYTGVYPTDLVQLEVRGRTSTGNPAAASVTIESEPGSPEGPVVVHRES